MKMRKSLFIVILMLLIVSATPVFAFTDPAGIIIENSVDKSIVNIGDQVVFKVNVTNNGSVNYTDVKVNATLPEGLQYLSHTSTGIYMDGLWSLGNLRVGVSKQLYITVNVTDILSGQIVDFTSFLSNSNPSVVTDSSTASLNVTNSTNSTGNDTNSTGNDTNGTNNTSSLILSIIPEKTSASPGELINYTIVINNTGAQNFTNLQIESPLPSGLKYVSHATNITNNNYVNGTWTMGNLKSGNCKYLNITAIVLLDQVGQNATLSASLLPNAQNATIPDVYSDINILNNVSSVSNTNVTSTISSPTDSEWAYEKVDNGTSYSDMVIDSQGNQHIVYFQLPNLKYAYKTSGGWVTETIETNTTNRGTGFYPAIALDSEDNPHVVYNDGNYLLKYAHKDQNGWHIENIAYADTSYTTIMMYNGTPRIGFFDNGLETVKYAYKNGTNWVVESVAQSAGHFNSMALDSSGNPRIAYYDQYTGSLKCAIRSGQNKWISVTVDNSTDLGPWNSLKIDSLGNPHISYIQSDGILKYAYWNGLNWINEVVDAIQTQGTNLILDELGDPKIIYFDEVNDIIKFAYKDINSSSWSIETINITNGASPWCSVVLNSLGVPELAYADNSKHLNFVTLYPILAKINSAPSSGNYNSPINVMLSSNRNGTIYYTTDGSDPRTSSNRNIYSGPITINKSGASIIKYAAVGNYSFWENVWSEVYTNTYVIDTSAPIVTSNIASGKYNTYETVKLSSSESSTIYYTLDGSNPKSSSTRIKYTSPLRITKQGTTNLKFTAVDKASNWATVVSKTYTLSFPRAYIKLTNRGTGKLKSIYYVTVTLPNYKLLYYKFSTYLYPNKSFTVNLGKFPVGTNFVWKQFNYNKAPVKKNIMVYTKFSLSNGKYFNQLIYVKKVKASHYAYSVEKTQITSVGIKATVIKSAVRK